MEKKEAAKLVEEEEEEEETRIYVGGLGEKVTDDDLLKIFSSFGKVKASEIVRTKGRSFGYVDFFPFDKSLSKLFSSYNGCVWKGGRLRLEKAKEHYLARLKREWAEDAEIESCPVSDYVAADKEVAQLDKPKKVLDVDKKINIFFPRLRKVKTLPFRGTGKHKYSFQRVEAHPVPKYFCDCEEHFAPFHAAGRKQIHGHSAGEEEVHDLEAQGGVINEEELNLMNSVMKKLFERENVSNDGHSETRLANDGHNSVKLIEDLQNGENEVDSVADEDGLVINAVSRGSNRLVLSRCQEKTTVSPKIKKLAVSDRTSKDRLAQNVHKEQKTNNFPPNKRKSSHNGESVVDGNPVDDKNLQTNRNKLRRPLGDQHDEIKSGVRQSTSSHSWSQKMSWKALVGDKDGRVFSVSNILPADASTEKDNATDSFEELKFDENESDDDNLIINVMSKKNKKIALSRNQEQKTISTMNQKLKSNENETCKDLSIEQKKSIPPPKKKMKLVINEEGDRNKSVHSILESAGNVQTYTNEMEIPVQAQPIEPEQGVEQYIADNLESRPSRIGNKGNDESNNSAKEELPGSDFPDVPPGSTDSDKQGSERNENLEGKSAETESVEPTKSSAAPNKSGKVSSWFQKSPWTQLVNENNNSFSITQISSGITFKKQELSNPHSRKESASPDNKKISELVQATNEPITHCSTAAEDGNEGVVSQSIPEKNHHTVEVSAPVVTDQYKTTPRQTIIGDVTAGETSVVSQSIPEKNRLTVVGNNEPGQRQTIIGDVTVGETCLFMRSDASIKEWSSVKAALSGGLQSHKRKRHEK